MSRRDKSKSNRRPKVVLTEATIAQLDLRPGSTLIVQPRANSGLGTFSHEQAAAVTNFLKQNIKVDRVEVCFLDARLELKLVGPADESGGEAPVG